MRLRPDQGREPAQDGDAETGAAVEQASQDGRLDGTKEGFGGRRGDAEQCSREEGKDDSMAVHSARLSRGRRGGQAVWGEQWLIG